MKISISLQNNHVIIRFQVNQNVRAKKQNDDVDIISLINLGPIVVPSKAKLSKISKEHLEKVENLHTVSSMHKHLPTTSGSTDILYEYDSGGNRLEQTNNKEQKIKGFFPTEYD